MNGLDIEVGARIADRYEIISHLGTGAMGRVVKALDHSLDGEVVALKLLHAHLAVNELAMRRFQQEVLVTRQLSHPNIVLLFDFESHSVAETFITLEYLAGLSLRHILLRHSGKKIPFEDVTRVLLEVTRGLAHAHQRGIIHRDLKPANVLLGESGTVKLTDFGFARVLEAGKGLTATGEALGTPLYMAPEQFIGGVSGPRSDIYALGILAFELAAGVPPFAGDGYYQTARMHLNDPLPAIARIRSDIPSWFSQFLETCTAKDPDARFSSAQTVLDFLTGQLGTTGNVTGAFSFHETCLTPALVDRSLERVRRFRIQAAMVIPILLLLLVYWIAMQRRYLLPIAKQIYEAEAAWHTELPMLKKIFRLQGSLAHPEQFPAILRAGDENSISALLLAGANPDWRDADGNTLLHYLSYQAPSELVNAFTNAHANFNLKNHNGDTALAAMIKQNNLPAVPLLLQHSNLKAGDSEGNTAAHLLVLAKNYTDLHRWILENRALYYRNASGRTPLHLAVLNHDYEATAILLLNTDADVRDSKGRTALMYVFSRPPLLSADHLVFDSFLPNESLYQAKDAFGRNVGMYAVRAGDTELINKLFEYHESFGAERDSDGTSALSYAIQSGQSGLVKQLLEAHEWSGNGNPFGPNRFGCTPLGYALQTADPGMATSVFLAFPADELFNEGNCLRGGLFEANLMTEAG